MLLLDREQRAPLPADTESGVIDDARRHRRLRRRRAAIAMLAATAIAGIAWVSIGGAARTHDLHHAALRLAPHGRGRDPARRFNVRLVPMVEVVGLAGWCEIPEEDGRAEGGACGGVPAAAQPLLQVFGWGPAHAHEQTEVAVTAPTIGAVLVEGREVATTPLRGLPYGLRAARVVSRPGATLRALDAHGHVVPRRWSATAPQATVRRWRSPHRPPSGACALRSEGLPGLAARGGSVAMRIRPFRGALIGHAFLPCAAAEYQLSGEPLRATVVLDAARPGSRPADLPSFHAVRGSPGMFAGGGLTAMRSGDAWLIAQQGHGSGDRMLLLRHLSASVHIGIAPGAAAPRRSP